MKILTLRMLDIDRLYRSFVYRDETHKASLSETHQILNTQSRSPLSISIVSSMVRNEIIVSYVHAFFKKMILTWSSASWSHDSLLPGDTYPPITHTHKTIVSNDPKFANSKSQPGSDTQPVSSKRVASVPVQAYARDIATELK